MLSILLADDNLLIRCGLKYLVSEEYRDVVFGEAKTGIEALECIAREPWDLVMFDLSLLDMKGLQILQRNLRQHLHTRLLVIGVEQYQTEQARHVGALGFVDKNARRPELLKAINTVLAGRPYFDIPSFRNPVQASPIHHNLSDREFSVMLLLAAGRRTSSIAAELNLHVKTVSTYKRRIFTKLRIESTADLVRYVIDHQLG